MDASPGNKNNAPSPAPPSTVKQHAAEPPPPPSSSSPPDAAAGTGTPRRDEEVDDEQVERFYALLANIRVMRGVFRTAGNKRKRRGEEPPWRPAFRMEDFEFEPEVEQVVCTGRTTRQQNRGGARRLPAAGSETGVAADSDGDGHVVE